MKPVHQSLNKKEAHISNNYTCHCWLPEGRFLVCTDAGDIMLCEPNGDYKLLLLDSPGEGFHIETIRTYTKGFIIAGDKGQIKIFDKTAEDPKNPYQCVCTLPGTGGDKKDEHMKMLQLVMQSRIKSIDLNGSEDKLLFTTENQ